MLGMPRNGRVSWVRRARGRWCCLSGVFWKLKGSHCEIPMGSFFVKIFLLVIPAKAGIQGFARRFWISFFKGMTIYKLSYKLFQFGFCFSINSNFHFLFHFLIFFSLSIAALTSFVVSKYTKL